MRRIIRSVLARPGARERGGFSTFLPVLALAGLLVVSVVASSWSAAAPADPSQNEPPTGGGFPEDSPDSSFVPQEGEEGGELGPGPEVGPEPSYLPDTSSTAPPTFPAVPKQAANIDTLLGSPLDTLSGAPMDTLRLPSAPSTSSAGKPTTGAQPPPVAAPPKARVGIFGLHPAAILLGLAALNYFIIKWASD